LRYTTALENKESSKKASGLTNSLFEDLRYLNEECSLNGNSILKRWKKKGAEGRKALLLQINPQMYPHNWAEARFDIAYAQLAMKEAVLIRDNYDISAGAERRPYRNVCLLPYVNLEALKHDPSRLLNILYSWVMYSPEQWEPYDNFILGKH
jgi:hypothetical protein